MNPSEITAKIDSAIAAALEALHCIGPDVPPITAEIVENNICDAIESLRLAAANWMINPQRLDQL